MIDVELPEFARRWKLGHDAFVHLARLLDRQALLGVPGHSRPHFQVVGVLGQQGFDFIGGVAGGRRFFTLRVSGGRE